MSPTLERSVELGGNCHQRPHLAARDHPERADRVRVGRVGHRERELALVLAHGQRARFAQEARGDAFLENGKLGIAGGVDEREAELCRERFGDVALRADAERDEQRAQPVAGFLLHAKRPLEP
jgi:hypothetical protein